MQKRYAMAVDITVDFDGEIVMLKDEDDRQLTKSGVEIYIQKRPANNIRPMARLPEGTLDKYKHCQPRIVDMYWLYLETE